MKNVTITLDDDLAAWARVEAAKRDKSLSRFVAELISQRRGLPTQREALERFLNAPDFPGITADLPSREELYAERLFHRHEHTPLHEGPRGAGQKKARPRMARRTRQS